MDEAVKLSIEQMEQVAGGILEDSVDPNAIYGTNTSSPEHTFLPTIGSVNSGNPNASI